MLKNFLIILAVIVVCGLGGFFIYRKLAPKGASANKFQWGITMRPAALGRYHPSIWQKQIDLAKKMGVQWVRIGWDYNDPVKAMEINDGIISYLEKAGLQPALVIEQNPAHKGKISDYQDGYNDGFTIASHFKGRIKVYQMANEGSAQVIAGPTLNGQTRDHYNQAEYQKLLNYLKGLSDGIYKADPSAKTIVSMVYTHFVYLDMLKEDGLKYDYIGIDWYDWMGKFEQKKLESGELLVDKLKTYNKPLVFAEINILADPDPKNPKVRTVVDQDKQANFIAEEAQWAWDNRSFVKGFYVLELIDNVNTKYPEYFGLISAGKSSTGVNVPSTPRKAYYAYQEVIRKAIGIKK